MEQLGFEQWFGILELPFLLVCIVYSFKTARTLKGGVFGQGMVYLAWGFGYGRWSFKPANYKLLWG